MKIKQLIIWISIFLVFSILNNSDAEMEPWKNYLVILVHGIQGDQTAFTNGTEKTNGEIDKEGVDVVRNWKLEIGN